MIEKLTTSYPNIIDLARYRGRADHGRVSAITPRICRHCGAALLYGEREDECSGALSIDLADLRLRWQAAQILRGLS